MNKAQQRAMQYAQTLNEVIESTQKIQENMHPSYQEIKDAMAAGNLADMDSKHYLEIQSIFQQGTNQYDELTQKLQQSKAPAKIMGVSILLVRAYQDYVKACQAMVDSMNDDRTIDQDAFDKAEADQDLATDLIAKQLQKMNQLS